MDYLGPALVYAGAFATGLLSALPALHAASKYLKDPLPSFIARFIASWTCLFVCALYGTIASAVLRLVGYGGLGQWTTARAFKWTMWCMTGVSFDVKDPTRSLQRRPAVLVGNHQTCVCPPVPEIWDDMDSTLWESRRIEEREEA